MGLSKVKICVISFFLETLLDPHRSQRVPDLKLIDFLKSSWLRLLKNLSYVKSKDNYFERFLFSENVAVKCKPRTGGPFNMVEARPTYWHNAAVPRKNFGFVSLLCH